MNIAFNIGLLPATPSSTVARNSSGEASAREGRTGDNDIQMRGIR